MYTSEKCTNSDLVVISLTLLGLVQSHLRSQVFLRQTRRAWDAFDVSVFEYDFPVLGKRCRLAFLCLKV